MHKNFLSSCLVLSVCLFCRADDEFEAPVVETRVGSFRGSTLTSNMGGSFFAFRGIPYALPPVGDLRFAKPQPFPRIEGVHDASELAPICIQPKGVDLWPVMQEDCLFLNVYVPPSALKDASNEELKKVFVYIHGGAFFMGSGNEFVPGDLVAYGDVIAVTLNYRLAWLGFLKGNTSELSGNQGMWDQLLALEWVKDNIESFGGDPNDITIGGESMGGESVSALSISPFGKGLFTKGVVMSGSMFMTYSQPGSSDVLLDLLTERVGCRQEESGPGAMDAAIRCLRNLPADAFVLPEEGWITNIFTSIDGEFFPGPIVELIKDKEYLERVGFYDRSYIASLTNNEGACYFHGPSSVNLDPDNLDIKAMSTKDSIPWSVLEAVYKRYQQEGNYFFKPAFDFKASRTITLPTIEFIKTFASRDPDYDGGKSYFLWFDFEPSSNPEWLKGVVHAMDLCYLLDITPQEVFAMYYGGASKDKIDFTTADVHLKEMYMNILLDFMKTGNPSATLTENLDVTWPPFEADSELYLKFDHLPTVDKEPLKAQRYIWDVEYPKILAEYETTGQVKDVSKDTTEDFKTKSEL